MRHALIGAGISALTLFGGFVSSTHAASYDLNADWSESANPHGGWSYNEGNNPLPHVASWQRNLGGWTTAQPGWAKSEDGSDRLPFWFKSNGAENFARDFVAGDIVVHTTDPANGVGSGPANVTWISPSFGIAVISGAVWIGRDIGRSNDWFMYRNDELLTSGHVASGDANSRSNPYDLADGTGGSGVMTQSVCAGDVIRLQFIRTSEGGEFVGVKLAIELQQPPAAPLAVNSAVSRKSHGATGLFGIALAPSDAVGSVPVECRLNGPTQIVFTFNQLFKAVDGTLDASEVSLSAGTIDSVTADCFRIIVNASGVPDKTCLAVTLNGISDLGNNPLTGPATFRVRTLFGDANNNGAVNILDLQAIKNRLNVPIDVVNFRNDVTLNGSINILDLQATKNNLNRTSACP